MRNHAKANDATDTKVGLNYGWGCKDTLGTSDHSQEMDCRPVAAGFSGQTEILQTLSEDIGANLNGLAQSFVKLSDMIKKGYKQSKDGGTDTENRHCQMLEKLDSQNVYFLHIRNGINKIVKSFVCSGLQRS